MLLWPLNSKNKISSAGTFSCPTQYFIDKYNSLLSFHFLCLSCQFNWNNTTQSNSLLLSSASISPLSLLSILMSSVSLISFVSSLVSSSSVSHVFCAIGISQLNHSMHYNTHHPTSRGGFFSYGLSHILSFANLYEPFFYAFPFGTHLYVVQTYVFTQVNMGRGGGKCEEGSCGPVRLRKIPRKKTLRIHWTSQAN